MAGLLKRLKDVISAEAHDMLDGHESPDQIARQLVREASDKVSTAQTLTIDAVAAEKQLAQQLNEHSAQLEKAQFAAEAALANDDEAGARRAVENKLHHKKLFDTLAPQLEQAKGNSHSLKNQLVALQQQLSSLKTEQLAIEARFSGAKATGKIDEMSAGIAISDDTQSRLQRANSLVSVMEARNEAVSEVRAATNPGTLTDADTDIELEMERLRKQMG